MTHFAWSTPTARKVHRCSLCCRSIRQGEKYHRMAALTGSEAWTIRECRHCQPVKDIAQSATGQYEYDCDLIAEWEPVDVAELRLKALWRKKWQHADGTLYPVPNEEPS